MNTEIKKLPKTFTFSCPTKLLGGSNALDNLPFEMKEKGAARPLVVMDEYALRLGYYRELKRVMKNDDVVIVGTYAKTTGEPKDCDAVVKRFKELDCDCIVGLGGGGVINVAKAAKLMLGQNRSAFASFEGDSVARQQHYGNENIPLFLLPCDIPGGTEATTRARIVDEGANLFYNFDSRRTCATAVILDKRLTDRMPATTMAVSGLGALAMGIEGFIDNPDNMIAQSYATAAINSVMTTLLPAMLHNGNVRYKLTLYTAIINAGVAYYNVKGSIVRDIATELSMRYKIDSQQALQIVFPYYYETRMSDERIFKGILMPLAGEDVYASTNFNARDKVALDKIKEFWEKVTALADIPTKLSKVGAKQSDFPSIAQAVIERYRGSEKGFSNYTYITELLEKAF